MFFTTFHVTKFRKEYHETRRVTLMAESRSIVSSAESIIDRDYPYIHIYIIFRNITIDKIIDKY